MFTEATAYADFKRDGKPDVVAMPIDLNFVPRPPVVLTGIDDPALTDITDQVIEGERPTSTQVIVRVRTVDIDGDGLRDMTRSGHQPAVRPASGTDSPRQIFPASRFEISEWRGTASTSPVVGFAHREWLAPSRLRWQPCRRRWRSRSPRFISR